METGLKDSELLLAIRQTLQQARENIVRNTNGTIVRAYGQVGRHIVEYEQRGGHRAEHGKGILKKLSVKLTEEFGSGFAATNPKLTRQFNLLFPIGHALRDQSSWTHCRTLLKVQDETARQWYLEE